jgi:imidazolonepropionase-like amidohydrolase
MALGQGDSLGTIEPGKLADVIVVDGDPLESMTYLKNIVHVFKDGTQYK